MVTEDLNNIGVLSEEHEMIQAAARDQPATG